MLLFSKYTLFLMCFKLNEIREMLCFDIYFMHIKISNIKLYKFSTTCALILEKIYII